MNYYDKLRDERRELILETAKKLICKKGISDTTVLEIAAIIGLSRQTVYKYFDNVDEMAYAIQKELICKMGRYGESVIAEIMSDESSALTALNKQLKEFFRYTELHTDDFLFITIFDAYYNSRPVNAELDKDYSAFFKAPALFESFSLVLKRGQQSGEIRADLSEKKAYVFFMNLFMALCSRLALLGRNQNSLSQEDKSIVEAYFIDMLESFLRPR